MSTDQPIPLPNDPNLEQLRKQARELKAELRRDDPAVKLSTAQRLVARRYGFASWPRLVRHLEIVAQYSWRPEPEGPETAPHDAFLRLACLTYTDADGPERWERARALLEADRNLERTEIHVAAACASSPALRALLREDPSRARQAGGPFGWEPLMYLAYARHDSAITRTRVVASARLLLDQGADPNAGCLWHGMPSPFTVLTGALGEGELGPARQPRHPHSLALARVVLEAGADPNDAQALYNRMFEDDDDHLVLLFEFGLGRDAGGPWRERLGAAVPAPAELLRGQLRWAVLHDQQARVRLLLEHDVDADAPFPDGRTPAEVAALCGNGEVVTILEQMGASKPRLEPVEAFVAAVLAGDRAAASASPDVVAAARAQRPGLMVWAAARRKTDAVALLIDLGFDVNAKGRSDVPVDDEWETPLHAAVANGDGELVEVLLAAGADPSIRDARFDAPPLGWAHYFGQRELVGRLAPITPE